MNKENFERAKWIPICIIAVLLMIIYKTFDNFTQITTAVQRFLWVISPLLFGVLFAYFFSIPYEKLEKLYSKSKVKFISKKSRALSVLTIFLFLILVIAFIMAVIMPILFTSIIDFAWSIPTFLNRLTDYLDDMPEDSVFVVFNVLESIEDFSSDLVNQFLNPAAIERFTRSLISIADGIVNVALGLIISLYILLEREKIMEFFKRLSMSTIKGEKARNRLHKYLEQINKVLVTFIASKGLDSIINLVVVTSILLIFNVQFAYLLGPIAGILNFIPYLGSLIAVLLISTITLLTGGVGKAIQVLIILLIFQQLDANFIEPRILRTSLKISPILVIISVLAGGAYFGILGMFLAVPIATIIKQILLEYISNSE